MIRDVRSRGLRLAMPVLAVVMPAALGHGCSSEAPTPAPAQRKALGDPAPETDSGLPAERPERLEIELRRRTADGGDAVLKLTPAGARYGLSHGRARVALSFRLAPEDLDAVYATLREHAVDRIVSERREGAPTQGTSLRVQAGPGRYSASAMGRQAPLAEHAQAYDACVDAVEALLPKDRSDSSDAVVELRWDPSVAEQAAALDLDVGSDLLGLYREPDAPPRWALHLRRPRALQVQLRAGTPPKATTVTIPEGGGAEVVLDPESGEVVLRPTSSGHTSGQTSNQ